jgi:hypothetical protein
MWWKLFHIRYTVDRNLRDGKVENTLLGELEMPNPLNDGVTRKKEMKKKRYANGGLVARGMPHRCYQSVSRET